MVRAGEAALGIGGLVGKAAVGFLGLIIVVGAFVPQPETVGRARPEPGDPAQSAITVTLRIPEGEPAGHVTVVNATGRELATVTYWYDGHSAVVARRDGGAGVSSHLTAKGTAFVRLIGTARQTCFDVRTDGSLSLSEGDPPTGFHPSRNPGRTGKGFPECLGPSMLGAISDIRRWWADWWEGRFASRMTGQPGIGSPDGLQPDLPLRDDPDGPPASSLRDARGRRPAAPVGRMALTARSGIGRWR